MSESTQSPFLAKYSYSYISFLKQLFSSGNWYRFRSIIHEQKLLLFCYKSLHIIFLKWVSFLFFHVCYNKKYNIFKGSLSLKELEKNLHNIANINSKFCINIDGIPFTSVKMCCISLLTAFEAGYQATVLLLLSLKNRPASVFNK